MAKKAKGRYHVVMMSCGYVENAMTSWLIFSTRDISNLYFETPKEAVTELALDLYAKFEDERTYGREPKKCCVETQASNAAAKFCATCGKSLADAKFDETCFMEFVTDLHARDCDAYGEAEYACDRRFMFWPFRAEALLGAKKNEYVLISENAEVVIRDALLEAKPELVDLTVERYVPDYKSDWEKIKEKGTNYQV